MADDTLTGPATSVEDAWLRPYDGTATLADVFHCFRLLLGRHPDAEEWVGHAAQAGSSLDDVVAAYMNSLEFARRPRRLAAQDAPILHRRPEFAIYASPDDPHNAALIAKGGYEPHVEALLRRLLGPGDGFLDIGANVGYFALLAARLVGPAGQVYAVEANADNARLLAASRLENGFDNLTVLQIAAGAAPGLLALHTMYSTGTTSPLADEAAALLASRTVPALPLDDLIPIAPRIALVKIDVDGAEPSALRGCTRLLARHRPVVITEFCPGIMPGIAGVDGYAYLDWLRAQGYALADAEGDQALPLDNAAILTALERRGTDHLDLIASPLGAAPALPARPDDAVARRLDALRRAAEDAAAGIAAANAHAADAERRARTLALARDRLAAARAEDATRHAAEREALAQQAAAEAAAAAARLARMTAERDAARAMVEAMRRSTSWRITAPLRRLRRPG